MGEPAELQYVFMIPNCLNLKEKSEKSTYIARQTGKISDKLVLSPKTPVFRPKNWVYQLKNWVYREKLSFSTDKPS